MKKIILPLLTIAALVSCKKEETNPEEGYKIPSTYNFENVSYDGQTSRLDMLTELTSYIKTGHTENTSLDANKMKDMFSNSNNPFSDADLNAASKNLQGKTFYLDTTYYVELFDSIAKYSGKTGGAKGQAGLITGSGRTILVDANGFEYAQLVDKGLMGACFYYQAASVYLTDEKIGDAVDNSTVTPGEGTDKEHHFDEAFGYFGAPIDFPSNEDDVRFWAEYCLERNEIAGTNKIMDAFLKGRAAISNKDKSVQNDAVSDIKMYWEKVSAATAIHYLNSGITNFSDDAERCHVLTEAYEFIKALKYNSEGSVTNYQSILDLLGDNFWDVTTTDIENARNALATSSGLESVKIQL